MTPRLLMSTCSTKSEPVIPPVQPGEPKAGYWHETDARVKTEMDADRKVARAMNRTRKTTA